MLKQSTSVIAGPHGAARNEPYTWALSSRRALVLVDPFSAEDEREIEAIVSPPTFFLPANTTAGIGSVQGAMGRTFNPSRRIKTFRSDDRRDRSGRETCCGTGSK